MGCKERQKDSEGTDGWRREGHTGRTALCGGSGSRTALDGGSGSRRGQHTGQAVYMWKGMRRCGAARRSGSLPAPPCPLLIHLAAACAPCACCWHSKLAPHRPCLGPLAAFISFVWTRWCLGALQALCALCAQFLCPCVRSVCALCAHVCTFCAHAQAPRVLPAANHQPIPMPLPACPSLPPLHRFLPGTPRLTSSLLSSLHHLLTTPPRSSLHLSLLPLLAHAPHTQETAGAGAPRSPFSPHTRRTPPRSSLHPLAVSLLAHTGGPGAPAEQPPVPRGPCQPPGPGLHWRRPAAGGGGEAVR